MMVVEHGESWKKVSHWSRQLKPVDAVDQEVTPKGSDGSIETIMVTYPDKVWRAGCDYAHPGARTFAR